MLCSAQQWSTSLEKRINSRERLLTALEHREPDRIPYDLGSTQVTGIHVVAYRRLRRFMGLPSIEPILSDSIQQLALPHDDLLNRLEVDIRGLFPLSSHNWNIVNVEVNQAWEYTDEWGITHRRSIPEGLYYSIVRHPLDRSNLTPEDIRSYPWPNTGDSQRIGGLREQALSYRQQGKAVMIKGVLAGLLEMSQRIRGTERLLMDMVLDERLACTLFDKILELSLKFWEMALPPLADLLDVISLADDYGTQISLIISPQMFRDMIKPRLKILFQRIKQLAPHAKLFFHSCGSVRPLLPDFIELGVDILNPVQIRASGMDPVQLKRDFGKAIAFWGGGVDTQEILPYGTPQQVKEDVRRQIEALAPGGGFVFNTVHNIQADVPPQNIMAMWEALQEYGVYKA